MTTTAEGVRGAVAEPGKDRASAEARQLFADLLAIDPKMRNLYYKSLTTRDWAALHRVAQYETGTFYGLWADDPVGFVEWPLGETTWSKQRGVLRALPQTLYTAVPSAFGTGKTHIAARAALWRSLVYPPGTSLTVTTATRFRQVQRQLWPHIRACVAKASLPLDADTTQLKAPNRDGVEVVVAYGFSAPPHDEAAVQGIHAPRLFIVVDEAGGISRVIGSAMRGLMTGADTRLLAIGNPPTDDEGSWFEQLCNPKPEDAADVTVIPISAYDAPQQTGERTRPCRACPPEVPTHGLGDHLVDRKWIEGTIRDYGEDAPFVIAKVHARFPRGGPARVIPADWIDRCVAAPEPVGEDYVRLCDLGLAEETRDDVVKRGAWIRLGVDVAADGGDEFVISRCIGDLVTIEHGSAGAANTNPMDVAGKILEHIRRAEQVRRALGTTAKVRVKIDGLGVGWGVAGVLNAWASEGIHDAEIVVVIVSEDTYRDDEQTTMRPYRKRDEMWLNGRDLVRPREPVLGDGGLLTTDADVTPRGLLRLRIENRTVVQLSAPKYGTNSQGRTVIESKKSMKARGVASPDRAEALLLALYEPLVKPRDKGIFEVIA